MKTNNEFWLDSSFSIKEMPVDTSQDGEGSTPQEEGKLTISGYANTISKDRAGDVIPASVWEAKNSLENYLKNPIVLFQHDHDEPIGKMVDFSIDSTGLHVTIEVFDVDSRVYKLIKEGVLRSFSVGFRMKDYDYDTDTDTFTINELELFEISVVSIPCNQDSTFSLKKSMKDSDFATLKAAAIAEKTKSTKPQTPLFNSELEKLAYMLDNQ